MNPRAWVVEMKRHGKWWPSETWNTRKEAEREVRAKRRHEKMVGEWGSDVIHYRVREYVAKEKS